MSTNKPSRQDIRAAKRKASKSSNVSATQTGNETKSTIKTSKWYLGFVAVLITFLCFSNVGNLDFVNWDDDRNTYENQNVVNFQMEKFGEHTKEIFQTHVIGNYNPLTILSFGISKEMHGIDNPGPWHWENLILHLICVLLVYWIATMLGLSWQGGLLVALLFGIHPMRVESVTWITERKDVLFGVFFLSALALYIRNKAKASILNVVIITILFILSCLSKIQAVTLPLTFLAVDYWMDKKLDFKTLWSKAHYFLISLVTGLVGIHFLRLQGSLETDTTFPFFQRLFIGSFSYIVYLIKSIIPYRLSPLYPYPGTLPWYFYVSMIFVPIFLWWMWKMHKAGHKVVVFGFAVFTFNVMFMLQVLGAGQGFIADRFTYIPYLGLFFIAGYYLDQYLKTRHKYAKLAGGIAIIYLLVAGVMTFNQNKIWKDSGTMWSHVLKYYDNSTLPYGNRANFYRNNKEYDKALVDYAKTLSLKPNQPEAYNSRGRLYFNLGGKENYEKALADYNKAIELMEQKPAGRDRNKSLGEFYINRGASYAMLGNREAAIKEMDKGLELKPDHQAGYLNRSVMYNQLGNFPKALEDIESYFKYNPYNADLWYEAARLKRAMNRPQDAISDFNQAIKLNGNNPIYYYERSRTHAQLGNTEQAKTDLNICIQMGYTKVDPAYKASLGM